MSDRRVIAAIVILLILFLAYWFMPRPPEQRIVDKFEQEQLPLIKKMISAKSNGERQEAADGLKEVMAGLSASDQRQMTEVAYTKKAELEAAFLKRERARIAEFKKMTPEEQRAAIDKHIDEQETINKLGSFPKRGLGGAGGAGMGGGSGGGGGSDAGGGSGDGPPKGISKGVERQMGFQRILESTSPEMRAEVGDYMQQVEQRRMERGLSPYPSN